MIRLTRAAVLLTAVLLAVMPATADKAKSLLDKGRDAEARQDYAAAYEFYSEAYRLKPKDTRYRASYERGKFMAGAFYVHRGQMLRDAGKLAEALADFQKAAQIDPSSFIAGQEIKRTQQMIQEVQNPRPQSLNTGDVLQERIQQAAGPVDLAPVSNMPITLRIAEDTKVIYETIGKLAGINVLFDPDYTSRRIKVELNGVTLQDALEIAALQSKTFWRPVTPNTIFVAANTPAKRKEVEQNVVRTFYLSNLSLPTELQDLVNTIRTIVEVSRVQQLPSQGAVVVRGTPDQIALVSKLVDDIDKARPEVVVEVAIMQVAKNKRRDLGIVPPSSVTGTMIDNISNNNNNQNDDNTDTTGTTNNQNGINLNSLAHISAQNFVLNIPSATANILFSDSDTKLLQNPTIRASDGQKATLKIGNRVPVATGSYQASAVAVSSLVNTQFQYLDVGVNVDITPRVHANGEITLKIVMDVSAVVSTQDIGGIKQPIIGQRKIEHEIRLKEGEVSLLGGMMEQQDDKTRTGLPFLSELPILRYIFGSTSVTKNENELVFALIPHIVRDYDVSSSNTRSIDVGTGTAIDLRRLPAQQPQAAPVQPPAQQPSQPQAQPQTQIPTPPAAQNQGQAVLTIEPATITARPGATFPVTVNVTGAHNLYAAPLQVSYDPKTLQLVSVSSGAFLSGDGQVVALVHRDDPVAGSVQITATRPPGASGVTGDGPICTLTFVAKTAGQSMLNINRAMLRDPAQQQLPASGSQAMVTVH